ncbi:hypothetical protein RBB83_17405 [Paenibacillus peoriae]|uniref:hypothetical protein n=1 Tax=Paenibacillus peoriae TaxID=59893 RepID=UPI0030D55E9D
MARTVRGFRCHNISELASEINEYAERRGFTVRSFEYQALLIQQDRKEVYTALVVYE